MAWKAPVKIVSASETMLVAIGEPVGTDDDSTISQLTVVIEYTDAVPSHLQVGSIFEVDANC